MTSHYDSISREYQASKLLPWRKHIEAYSYLEWIGSVDGKSVLDLACGEGFYSRQFKLRGASAVTGVDLSEGMIALAVEIENKQPLHIDYLCVDATKLALNHQFDFVCASYLLNYAPNVTVLKEMCEAIFMHTKPGGSFITVNSNPDHRSPVDTLLPYGFTRENASFNEGAEVIYRFYQADGSFVSVTNFHLEKATYQLALEQAGFRDVRWHDMRVSSDGLNQFESGHWDAFMRDQPVVGISCLRPN
jgi:2-polyprenyl-3-methyl-5-hydroxy-6-metoxy-1,4-benzoquinol methylase